MYIYIGIYINIYVIYTYRVTYICGIYTKETEREIYIYIINGIKGRISKRGFSYARRNIYLQKSESLVGIRSYLTYH